MASYSQPVPPYRRPPSVVPDGQIRLKLVVAYDGGQFHGVAPQPGVATVGDALASALGTVLRQSHPPVLVMAGRTDAGVHAHAQVCHVDIGPPPMLDLDKVLRSLRSMLAPAIVVRSIEIAPDLFDARYAAMWRRYRYTLLNRAEPDPFLAATTWHVPEPLDLALLRMACDPLIGEHDFSSFCKAAEMGRTNTRTVLAAGWQPLPDGLLRFEITATAFCRQMVRSITGLLVDIGKGASTPADVRTVLMSQDRTGAPPVAPAHGLCLWEVGYQEFGGDSQARDH